MPDDEDIGRRAEELYRVWTALEEAELRPPTPLVFGDIVAFLAHGKPLTQEQQRALFADPRLRAVFQSLKFDFAVTRDTKRMSHADAGRASGTSGVLEIPIQIAAASKHEADFHRQFDGGSLRVCPAGINEQVYVVISLDDPALAPRTLMVENATTGLVVQTALPPPGADGEIVMIKDLSDQDDLVFVGLLRDPTVAGTFLR